MNSNPWIKTPDGSYIARLAGHNYTILRDRENQLYIPQADNVNLRPPSGRKGYFVLREAKRCCERHALESIGPEVPA